MRVFKYVIVDSIMPVVFKAPLQHKDMQKLGPITSAGYFALSALNDVTLAGEAISISVPPGKNDKALLERFLDEHAL